MNNSIFNKLFASRNIVECSLNIRYLKIYNSFKSASNTWANIFPLVLRPENVDIIREPHLYTEIYKLLYSVQQRRRHRIIHVKRVSPKLFLYYIHSTRFPTLFHMFLLFSLSFSEHKQKYPEGWSRDLVINVIA